MNIRQNKVLLSLVVTILGNFEHLKHGYCRLNRSTVDLMTLALHRNIKFMFERPKQMNEDAIFGLILAQVHVAAVLEHRNPHNLSQRNRWLLEEMLMLCKIAKNDGKEILMASGFETMVRPDIWNRTIFWKRDALGQKPSTSRGLTRDRAEFLIHQGSPTEPESTRCLLGLLGENENFDCAVSKECAEMLVRKDSSRGYPLTHRLLYVQAAIALRCKEHSHVRFAGLKKNFCTAILQDLVDLEAMNFPASSIDLAMEQILLCGMEGYLEFANEHYAKLIASWPNSHGCYSGFRFHHGERKIREKRTTAFMDYGCDSHASGLGAASLALLIRSAVENVFL